MADFYQQEAEKSGKVAAELKRLAATLPGEIDLSELHRISTSLGTFVPAFTLPVEDALIANGKTNIKGEYEVGSLPPGSYYVCAMNVGGSFLVEWLVPVVIDGKDVAVDLSNDNAILIKNVR